MLDDADERHAMCHVRMPRLQYWRQSWPDHVQPPFKTKEATEMLTCAGMDDDTMIDATCVWATKIAITAGPTEPRWYCSTAWLTACLLHDLRWYCSTALLTAFLLHDWLLYFPCASVCCRHVRVLAESCGFVLQLLQVMLVVEMPRVPWEAALMHLDK